MKRNVQLVLAILILYNSLVAQTWKSPDYKPEVYRKVMVLAKISDAIAKRQVEDATIRLLQEKGIAAISAYQNITESDLTSEERFLKKADQLEIDALLVYTIINNNTIIKNTPSVNMSVGVPIRVGIFGGFVGGNVPIAGGTKSISIIKGAATFYNRSSKTMQWSYSLEGRLKNTDKVANDFAKKTIKALFNSNLFIQ